MHLKPPPKLQLKQDVDTLHHTIDDVVAAVKKAPKTRKKSMAVGAGPQHEKQVLLHYFAELLNDFFAELNTWQALPFDEAQEAYKAYMSGVVPALPATVKSRFVERAETYAEALFEIKAHEENAHKSQLSKAAFANLIEGLERVVLASVAASTETQSQVITIAFSDYHQALNAGVQAGLIDQPTAEFMVDDLKQQLLLETVWHAVLTSDVPMLLALEVADGVTGDADIDGLPEADRQQFVAKLLEQQQTLKNGGAEHDPV